MVSSQKGKQDSWPQLENLISLITAAKLSGLSTSHLRLLVRQNDIWGRKIGRDWFTTEQAVREYQARARPRGRPTKT